MPETSPAYIVDTCSFTEVRRVYPRDVFPGVWDKLDDLASAGVVASVDLVLDELRVQDDEVTKWAKRHLNIFLPLDEAIQQAATNILSQFPDNFVDLKKRKSGADPFVIATAITCSCTVVTQEKPSGGPHKVKIPDVCRRLNVDCIALLELLRREGLRL